MAGFVPMRQSLLLMLECSVNSLPGGVTPTLMLMLDTHDFDAASAALWVSDVVADEASAATGYARQVVTFPAGPSIDTDGRAIITWDDTDFGLIGGAVDAISGGMYMFGNTGNDATSPLLWSTPSQAPVSTDGGQYVVRWSNPTVFVSP